MDNPQRYFNERAWIDEIEKGYYLNDKIIRFAKVVVGK